MKPSCLAPGMLFDMSRQSYIRPLNRSRPLPHGASPFGKCRPGCAAGTL